jgi:hypothetical protein
MIPLSDLAKCDQDALTTLQKVYSDPKAHQSDWLKAVSAAIAYERASQLRSWFKWIFANALRPLDSDSSNWTGRSGQARARQDAPRSVP